MRKQNTFYGNECEREAIEWLEKVEKLFYVDKCELKTYIVKGKRVRDEKRCKIILTLRWI